MSLVVHLKFEDNINDSSGNGNNGVGTTQVYVNGKLGKAVDYNSAGLFDVYFPPVNKYGFSVSYWARGTATPASDYRRVWQTFDENNVTYFMSDTRQVTNHYILHYVKDFALSSWSTRAMISMADYTQWTWNHYVSVWNGTQFDSYRNGIFLGTNVVTQDLEPYKNINRIQFNGSNTNQIEVDDFRLFDHALSVKEVKELSKAKVLHYKFDDHIGWDSNMVENGDCVDALPSMEGFTFPHSTHFSAALSNEQAKFGNQSLKITRTNTTTAAGHISFRPVSPSTFDLNKTYKISFWFYRPSTSPMTAIDVRLQIGADGGTSTFRRIVLHPTSLNTDGWTKIELVTAPALNYMTNGVYFVYMPIIYIHGMGADADGHFFYFDGFDIREHIEPDTIIDSSSQENHAALDPSTSPVYTDGKMRNLVENADCSVIPSLGSANLLGRAIVASSAEQAKFGTSSLKITRSDATTNTDTSFSLRTLDFDGGITSVSFWVYVPSSVNVNYLRIHPRWWYPGSNDYLDKYLYNRSIPRDQWFRMELGGADIPTSVTDFRLSIIWRNDTGAVGADEHSIYLDGFQVEHGRIPTTFKNNFQVTDFRNNVIGTGAYEFDGDNDVVNIPTTTLLSTSASLACWVYISDFTTGKSSTGRILCRGVSEYTSMLAFYNGGYSFETDTNSNPHELAGRTTGNVTNAAITANSWFHFALVFDSGTYYGYINGTLVNSAAITNNLTINSFAKGAIPDNYPAFFRGKLDDVRIYSTALSADDIQELYQTRASLDNSGNFFIHNIKTPILCWKQFGGPLATSFGTNISDANLLKGSISTTVIPYEVSGEFGSHIDLTNFNLMMYEKGATWYKTIKHYDSNGSEVSGVGGYSMSFPAIIKMELDSTVCLNDVYELFNNSSILSKQLSGPIKVWVNGESIGQTDIAFTGWSGTGSAANLGLANPSDTFGQPPSNYLTSGAARHIFSYTSTSTGQNAIRCQPICWTGTEDVVSEIVWSCIPK